MDRGVDRASGRGGGLGYIQADRPIERFSPPLKEGCLVRQIAHFRTLPHVFCPEHVAWPPANRSAVSPLTMHFVRAVFVVRRADGIFHVHPIGPWKWTRNWLRRALRAACAGEALKGGGRWLLKCAS